MVWPRRSDVKSNGNRARVEVSRPPPPPGYIVLPRFEICVHCGQVAQQVNKWGRFHEDDVQVGITGRYRCKGGHEWQIKRRGGSEYVGQDEHWVRFSRLGPKLRFTAPPVQRLPRPKQESVPVRMPCRKCGTGTAHEQPRMRQQLTVLTAGNLRRQVGLRFAYRCDSCRRQPYLDRNGPVRVDRIDGNRILLV